MVVDGMYMHVVQNQCYLKEKLKITNNNYWSDYSKPESYPSQICSLMILTRQT